MTLGPAPPSPPASRLRPPRWLDARLLVGLLLVLVSVAAGAKILAGSDHASNVLVAKHVLVPGERLTGVDVTVRRARFFGDADRYVSGDRPLPDGYVVVRSVGRGELLPVEALSSTGAAADTRMVAIPVTPGHYPEDLGRGDAVDVYLTAKAGGTSTTPPPVLVATRVAVQSVSTGSRGFGATASTVTVQLSAPVAGVPALVRAAESGAVDLVRVPANAPAGEVTPGSGLGEVPGATTPRPAASPSQPSGSPRP